jgi:hypothetical protein
MAVIRNPRLIKETVTVEKDGGTIVMDEITAAFIVKRYFHYGILAMMHGEIFGSQMRFAVKMKYSIYWQIPKQLKRAFIYSSKLFGHTFFPVLENSFAKKYGYNMRPDPEVLKRIAEFTETDQIYKLVTK